ncbi:MAG: hypothetical protein L3K25_07870 [Gammaproteobacteria bacterium]|nr:hypothetical protein [Gammaproteobacteria bacterium]
MTFENENKTIPIAELEPLVEKIEAVTAVLNQYLLACAEFGQPPREISAHLGTELNKALDLQDWLDELR